MLKFDWTVLLICAMCIKLSFTKFKFDERERKANESSFFLSTLVHMQA